jgi:hypothetical protein
VQQNRRDEEREDKRRQEKKQEGNRTEESVTTPKTEVSFLCSCWQLVAESVCLCSNRSCCVLFCMFAGPAHILCLTVASG